MGYSSGDDDYYFFFLWFFVYWLIFEIDFILMTCFPLRAYRLGFQRRNCFRTKELYQDVIRYFENRCSCCNIIDCCCKCSCIDECPSFRCCCGVLHLIRLVLFFSVGILFWVLLFPFLLLPLGCDCIYECELRSKHPIQCNDFCFFCSRAQEEEDEAQQTVGNDDETGNNNNGAQNQNVVPNNYNQAGNGPIYAQPFISDPTQQCPQTPVYQQCSPYAPGQGQGQQYPQYNCYAPEPAQAQKDELAPVYPQCNPYASGQAQQPSVYQQSSYYDQNQSVSAVQPANNPYV